MEELGKWMLTISSLHPDFHKFFIVSYTVTRYFFKSTIFTSLSLPLHLLWPSSFIYVLYDSTIYYCQNNYRVCKIRHGSCLPIQWFSVVVEQDVYQSKLETLFAPSLIACDPTLNWKSVLEELFNWSMIFQSSSSFTKL